MCTPVRQVIVRRPSVNFAKWHQGAVNSNKAGCNQHRLIQCAPSPIGQFGVITINLQSFACSARLDVHPARCITRRAPALASQAPATPLKQHQLDCPENWLWSRPLSLAALSRNGNSRTFLCIMMCDNVRYRRLVPGRSYKMVRPSLPRLSPLAISKLN